MEFNKPSCRWQYVLQSGRCDYAVCTWILRMFVLWCQLNTCFILSFTSSNTTNYSLRKFNCLLLTYQDVWFKWNLSRRIREFTYVIGRSYFLFLVTFYSEMFKNRAKAVKALALHCIYITSNVLLAQFFIGLIWSSDSYNSVCENIFASSSLVQ